MGNMNCSNNSITSKNLKPNSPTTRPMPKHNNHNEEQNRNPLTLPHLKPKGNAFKDFLFLSSTNSQVHK